LSYKEIAINFDIREATVRGIKNGKLWKKFTHLVNPEIQNKRFVNITCKRAKEIFNTLIETNSKSETCRRCNVTWETIQTMLNSDIYKQFDNLRIRAKEALTVLQYHKSNMTDDIYVNVLNLLNKNYRVFDICKELQISRAIVNHIKFGTSYGYFFNKYKHLRYEKL
jgi:hypothetical protein